MVCANMLGGSGEIVGHPLTRAAHHDGPLCLEAEAGSQSGAGKRLPRRACRAPAAVRNPLLHAGALKLPCMPRSVS